MFFRGEGAAKDKIPNQRSESTTKKKSTRAGRTNNRSQTPRVGGKPGHGASAEDSWIEDGR